MMSDKSLVRVAPWEAGNRFATTALFAAVIEALLQLAHSTVHASGIAAFPNRSPNTTPPTGPGA
jgi:hypothetical protein